MKKKLIAPSILSADFSRLGEEIKAVEKAGADWIHVDVMDGHFVPNITIGPLIVEAARKVTGLPLDVHLMIEQPERYLKDFVSAGASSVTVHQEAVTDLERSMSLIHELGANAGVSINPATPVETIVDILQLADLVLVMTVNPGFGGQKFMESCLKKISKLREIRQEKKLEFLIEADGGISKNNARLLSQNGCDIFVAGSAIFKSPDISGSYVQAIESIRSEL